MTDPIQTGITLIALIITIIVLLILAGIALNLISGSRGIPEKAVVAKEKYNYAEAKEKLEIMLLDVKMKVATEEGRQTVVTDCDKINDKEGVSQIEYINGIGDKPKYAVIIYNGYEFKVDDDLKILQESDILEEESQEYKKQIAQTLTDLGVKTDVTQSADTYGEHLKILADKNYEEGKESDIVLLKSNLNSRYEQTVSLANVEGHPNFDAEDFIIVTKDMSLAHTCDWEDWSTVTKSYDKKSGTLILGKQKAYASKNSWTFWNTYDLYAIKRKPQEVKLNDESNNRRETLEAFKEKLAQVMQEYGIQNEEGNLIVDKTAEEISVYIRRIARNKFEEGVATYKILIQENLASLYNQTVSVNHIENYQNLTLNDFFIVSKNMSWAQYNDHREVYVMSKVYNQEAGTLEFGIQMAYSHVWTIWNTYDVFWLKKKIINLEENVS